MADFSEEILNALEELHEKKLSRNTSPITPKIYVLSLIHQVDVVALVDKFNSLYGTKLGRNLSRIVLPEELFKELEGVKTLGMSINKTLKILSAKYNVAIESLTYVYYALHKQDTYLIYKDNREELLEAIKKDPYNLRRVFKTFAKKHALRVSQVASYYYNHLRKEEIIFTIPSPSGTLANVKNEFGSGEDRVSLLTLQEQVEQFLGCFTEEEVQEVKKLINQ